MKSVKSKLYSFPGHQLEENGRVRNLEIDKDTYIIAKIIARNPIIYNFISLPALSRKGLTGLQRPSKDSYMNSLIQCLSNTLELTENIISGKLKNVMIAKHQNKYRQLLVYYYIKLIKQIWTGEIKFFDPIGFKSTLEKQPNIMNPRDLNQTLAFIINKVHEKLSTAPDYPQEGVKESESEQSIKYWEQHIRKNSSIIVDLFHGQYRSEYNCYECQSKRVQYEIFPMIDLQIDYIQTFRETHEIIAQSNIYCDVCNKYVKGVKTSKIDIPPHHLIICIKRFDDEDFSIEKNEILKIFPIKNMIVTTYYGKKECYDLYAINNSLNSYKEANYKAIAKNIDGNWYEFNNMFVTRIDDMNSIITSNTCILFYKQKNF